MLIFLNINFMIWAILDLILCYNWILEIILCLHHFFSKYHIFVTWYSFSAFFLIVTKTTDDYRRLQTTDHRLQTTDDYRRVRDESQTTTDESQTTTDKSQTTKYGSSTTKYSSKKSYKNVILDSWVQNTSELQCK